MGKFPYYTDSEETEATSASSVENTKKKKLSILKRSSGNVKKKKCKLHTKSEPDDSDYRSRSKSSIRSKFKPRGILKYDRERESTASEEEEESEPIRSLDRCFVGRVPRPSGSKPGRGGGVSIIVRRNVNSRFQCLEPQVSTSSNKRRKSSGRLSKKRSY
ncbi:hypothetical protein K1T71_012864 [Dendrolimus kikuchii]|uniref:Uncharacterized protein n=1 Tax=Dendrolimus kikuchii TaxID=765133 RepID=A0ACC1CIA0_9NEOP|nr:hypothetical protein K1T71_012864 [Dendrolimus kikuchii]